MPLYCNLMQRKVRTPKKSFGIRVFSKPKRRVPGQLTAGRSDPTESATEKIPPAIAIGAGKGEMVG